MRLFWILVFPSFLVACTNAQPAVEEYMFADEETSEIVTAKLIRKKAYNKAGREMPYSGDFFLILNGTETFVKLMESKVTSEQLEPLLDQKSKFSIIQREGLWDTDDPNVQSRIGPYVAILEIL